MPSEIPDRQRISEELGFCFDTGGTHLARTMMFDDLTEVFDVCGTSATKEAVIQAVDEENCLGKPSGKARRLAARHLVKLYGFEDKLVIYRALAYLWSRDEGSRPVLALLCAYARDAVLRSSKPFIYSLKEGEPYTRQSLEEFMNELEPDRFSPAMLRSLAQNLAGTWTQSEHLTGRTKKTRTLIHPGPGAVVMATLMSYLTGSRGLLTFESEYVKLLDCSVATAIELAKSAAQRGWMDVKHIGDVVEVSFPRLLNDQEWEMLRE
ncbi:hypothetical protein OAU26_07635 [Mariniblastus sp.]|nr:hypothetical protein [Mariniblastus sp.]